MWVLGRRQTWRTVKWFQLFLRRRRNGLVHSPFGVLSQVDGMRGRAVFDAVAGDTRIFGMVRESRVGVVVGGASVGEVSGESRIDVVASGGGVDYMLGDASVGKVCGRASMMCDRSHVDYVMDGGFVGGVHGDASVDSVAFRGRVKGVYEGGRVALVDAGGVVEHVLGSARRLRGFWRSR